MILLIWFLLSLKGSKGFCLFLISFLGSILKKIPDFQRLIFSNIKIYTFKTILESNIRISDQIVST